MKTVTNYLLMGIVTIAMFVGYGCSQDAYVIQDDFSDVQGSLSYKELSEIAYSAEYEQYLWAKLKLNDFLTETDFDEMEFMGIINGVQVYHLDVSEPISGINNAYARLITQFPNYALANKENKLRAQNIAVLNSNRLSSALKIGKNEIGVTRSKDRTEAETEWSRLKNAYTPNHDFIPYGSISEGYEKCIDYGRQNKVECGGYVFGDNSSLVLIDKNAIANEIYMAIWSWMYTPIYTFHYHPGGTPTMSEKDTNALRTFIANGVTKMVILTYDEESKTQNEYEYTEDDLPGNDEGNGGNN